MDIVIHSMGMPFNGDTLKTKSLGGSESAAYYQAMELARRGHKVTVFTTTQEETFTDGVRFCSLGQPTEAEPLGNAFTHYAANTPHDVLIIQRHPLAFHRKWASKVNLFQMHDLALHRSAGMLWHGMWQVDAVTVVSEFHKKQVIEVYGFDPNFVKVVPNGVDVELYNGTPDSSPLVADLGEFTMLYQSRPERGLEHLLRPGGIMDRLRDTRAHLYYCSYDNTVGEMVGYYNQLNEWAARLPNVTNLGALTKAQLAVVQKSVNLMVYPTEFEEVSCITAMEAMHAGTVLLTSACAALPETCEGSGTYLIPLKDGRADEDAFVDQLLFYTGQKAKDPSKSLAERAQRQLDASLLKTWGAAVDALEQAIEGCFDVYSSNTAATLRDCIAHSEIHLAKRIERNIGRDEANPIVMSTLKEIAELYAFTATPDAYEAHYRKYQDAFYNEFEDSAIGQDVTSWTRFRGVVSLLKPELDRKPNLRMLDYGCAHGHFMMPIAKESPQARFVGVDVSERAVAAATKWMLRDKVTNVSVVLGKESLLDDVNNLCPLRFVAEGAPAERDLFDVILAGEVLEHVVDPMALLEKFRKHLRHDGLLIITTPTGRWEWTGTEDFKTGREHLAHFERNDIKDLCGRNHVDILCAPAGGDKTGSALGSWVWGVRPVSPFEEIDYSRKMWLLAPRQTVSACMIVKDGAETIVKCLRSFIDWVDQLVIAVDPATKDNTRQLITDFMKGYPYKAFTMVEGVEALKVGFAEARNKSIEHAVGDWILWLDADEEVQSPWNLWKYLRPSQHRAFGFPQVHYSADPATVLTTDLPCRLYRNTGKAKFHGLVHEHPEEEQGKAIQFSTVRDDVKFLHSGYVDEATRRGRYSRNLPLLLRDIKENPDRSLNKFLYLRDLAQGISFEHEQTGGVVLETQPERARRAIKLWEDMLELDPIPMRMLVDSLQYYSICVATLGAGFEAEVSLVTAHPQAPGLSVKTTAKGRFMSKDHFFRLSNKIQQEATKHYESKYL